MTFPSAKKFKVTGTVRDICPKDGYGAYIEFKVNFAGGGYATDVRKDTTGCKDAATSYTLAHTFKRKIVSVGVTLIEIDADTDAIGDAARKLIKRSQWSARTASACSSAAATIASAFAGIACSIRGNSSRSSSRTWSASRPPSS